MTEPPNKKQRVDNDLLIVIGDKQFEASREVLMKRLRFFARKISTEMLKEKQTVIVLKLTNVVPEVFEDVLQYIYTSQIKFTTANLESIYTTADYLHFEDLLDEAEKAMKNVSKTEKMIVIVMNIARNHQLKTIESECIQSIILNPLSEVGKKHLIPALTFAHLKVLLKRITDRKEDMFHLCVEWIGTDQANRARKLSELLQLIPLNQLSLKFLNETVLMDSNVRNNSESLLLFIEALKALMSTPQTSNETLKPSMSKTFDDSENSPVSNHNTSKSPASECLYVIGGEDRKVLSSVSKLDSLTNKWVASVPMPTARSYFGCAVIGQKIYVCGGDNRGRCNNKLTVYDTNTEQWTKLRQMKYARRGCAMAELGGFLYVAGGYADEGLSVVERYSVENNQWETVTPMTTIRCGLELVSMNGFLYAIGGSDGSNEWSSVERYNPQTNIWKEVASLHNAYFKFGSAVFNNHIYVTDRNTCEVYHPEVDKWHTMPAPRENVETRLTAFNGELLVVGGNLGTPFEPQGSTIVERFDFEANAWVTEEEDMNVARCFHGIAVVKSG